MLLKFETEYTLCGALAWNRTDVRSDRKNAAEKKKNETTATPKGANARGVLLKVHETQRGSVCSPFPLRKCGSIVWISVMLLLAPSSDQDKLAFPCLVRTHSLAAN